VKTRGATNATPTATPATITAPRAQPVETPVAAAQASTAVPTPDVQPTATPVATPLPITTPVQTAVAAATEPEVRRAEPVRAQDEAAASPTAKFANKIEIKPLKKTYIRIVVDGKSDSPAVERWVTPSDKLLKVTGQRINIRVLDRSAVQIRKNGVALADDDSDVTIE
jgi:hypothetical protein